MEELSGGRAGDSAIGTDEGDIEAECVSDWQREIVPAACHQSDLDSRGVGAGKSFHVGGRDLELGVEQGTVDVDGYEANGHG